jgi:hypothetical protein
LQQVEVFTAACLFSSSFLATLYVPEHFKGIEQLIVLLSGTGISSCLTLIDQVTIKKTIVGLVHELNQIFREEHERVPLQAHWAFLPEL